MFELDQILRPHIKSMEPYSSARDEFKGTSGIFLDANENSMGSITSERFNRYPDPYQWELKKKISQIKNVKKEQIFLGNGSDEIIDLIFRLFCGPGKDNTIIMPPTYGMYEVSASINDVIIKKVALTDDYQIDLEAVLKAVDTHTKIIWICSPNNPTGNLLNLDHIQRIIASFSGIVVIDEAYIDFSPYKSLTSQLQKYPNLIIIQTFSKAWGLASLRLGMAFTSEEIIFYLNKIKPPYNINGLTQSKILDALEDESHKNRMVNNILYQKKLL
jgi:histidinol-phosphate aminotransferase